MLALNLNNNTLQLNQYCTKKFLVGVEEKTTKELPTPSNKTTSSLDPGIGTLEFNIFPFLKKNKLKRIYLRITIMALKLIEPLNL